MQAKLNMTKKILQNNKEASKIINQCRKSRSFRRALAYKSHWWFFYLYLQHHAEHRPAWFHKEMFRHSEKEGHNLTAIMAFRGAGKSTIMNLSLALWSILGKPQKKLVVIISKEKSQARLHLDNIIQELASNEMLKNDFFNPKLKSKRTNIVEIEKYQAKIMVMQSLKSLRGLKNGRRQPDLIICDDLEDIKSTANESSRKNLFNWFFGEVLSAGGPNTDIIILGNSIHLRSLLMNIYSKISSGEIKGDFFSYPLLDDNSKVLWPEKYNEASLIDKIKDGVDQDTWLNDFLLVQTRGIQMADVLEIMNSRDSSFDFYKESNNKNYFSQKNYKISAPNLISLEYEKVKNQNNFNTVVRTKKDLLSRIDEILKNTNHT